MKETAGQKIQRLERERDDAATQRAGVFKTIIEQRRIIRKLEGRIAELLKGLNSIEEMTADPDTARFARWVLTGGGGGER
ncbi:hypothetical protein [Paenibacillus sp. RUD330]|uniref:hypothetical protein n=1 Tax=Paenibacillus sp. RUD330 TaxID=2023772 RepID=UPI000B9255B8|nr:hypothetical protein [Paenibacillus sp. RUD330]ASS66515.1 hypothetical protein CIC07_10380 [Paenibacillus sp. RUD330]